MPKQISKLTLKGLRNCEYTLFINQIVTTVLKYDVEQLHLKKSFYRLMGIIPKIDKMKELQSVSSYCNMIRDLDVEREKIFTAIISMVSSLEKSGISTLSVDILLVNKLLDKHGRNFTNDSYNLTTQRINNLLSEIELSAELIIATAKLSLTFLLDQLKKSNEEFEHNIQLHIDKDEIIEELDTRSIRAETDKILLAFFSTIEFCIVEYEELDFKNLTQELNELIEHYRINLYARETRRKQGKDTAKEKPIVGFC